MNDVLIIEAGRSARAYWSDIWRYRELFYVLAWRDMMIRYKQTAVGVLWAFLQPLIPAVITTVIMTKVAHAQSIPGVPYFLMVLCGTLPWQFFGMSLSSATQSVVGNANLISKVYFPRLIVPAGAVVTALADFLITLVPLFVAMAWAHILPSWRLALLPAFLVLALLAALGPGLLLTALTVKYRDFRLMMPLILTVGTWLSPVYYWSELVAPQWRPIYALNPLAGVIEGFRWSICGQASHFHPGYFAISTAMNLIMVGVGVWYFRKTERTFADLV